MKIYHSFNAVNLYSHATYIIIDHTKESSIFLPVVAIVLQINSQTKVSMH